MKAAVLGILLILLGVSGAQALAYELEVEPEYNLFESSRKPTSDIPSCTNQCTSPFADTIQQCGQLQTAKGCNLHKEDLGCEWSCQ